MSKSKLNIVIAVLTGILVGFVLGAAFGTPDKSDSPKGLNAAGNISRVATVGRRLSSPMENSSVVEERVQEADTTRFEAYGKNGENMEIIIIKK